MDYVKAQAIQELIHSITNNQGHNNNDADTALTGLANRILDSTIGGGGVDGDGVVAPGGERGGGGMIMSTTKDNQQSNNSNNNNNTREEKKKRGKQILKRMERSYHRKKSSENHHYHEKKKKKNKDDDDHHNTKLEMNLRVNKVNKLYKELWKREGEDIANDIMILFTRLAGTGTGMQRTDTDTDIDIPSSSNRNNDTTTPTPPINDKRENVIHSKKHVELAIYQEESTILRECLYALQNINGENIRFYHHHNKNNHNKNNEEEEEELNMEYYEGIRIRPGLLPFHLDPETIVTHQSTRMLTSGSLDALRSCGEAGWLYSRITSYIHTVLNNSTNSGNGSERDGGSSKNGGGSGGCGVVPRALASALSKELTTYHHLLQTLEKQLIQTTSSSSTTTSTSSTTSTSRGNTFTIRRLMIQLRQPIKQLRSMSLLTDGVHPQYMNGGQLLSSLYLHSMHGDVRHCELIERVLYSTSLPWYDMLYDWTMRGILFQNGNSGIGSRSRSHRTINTKRNQWDHDHHDEDDDDEENKDSDFKRKEEFFITENTNVGDEHMWHDRYKLSKHQIPYVPGIHSHSGTIGCGIMNNMLATEILIVGKGINFIRRCLYDTQWNLDLRDILPRNDVDFLLVGNHEDDEVRLRRIKSSLGFEYDTTTTTSSSSSSSSQEKTRRDISGRNGTILTQSRLERTVAIASQQVHKHILTSLYEEHHLALHLRGLKEVLFLGQGDFVSALMDGLHIEFDSNNNSSSSSGRGTDGIYMHSMMGILHDALRSTNAKFLPEFVLERIHVKLLPTENIGNKAFWCEDNDKNDENDYDDDEKTGWDIFSLGYEVDAPLTAIVHPEAMDKYQLVFTLLFRLKRIEWMLNNTWRQSTSLNHALIFLLSKYGNDAVGGISSSKRARDFSRMKLLLRKFSMTRQTMLHFITNFQSYLMFEVLESGWKELEAKLGSATTLDEVIRSHNEYLDDIIMKSLVGESSGRARENDTHNLGRHLRLVLSVAYRFCRAHEKIFSEALSAIQKATEKRRSAERRTKAGKWGFDSIDADVEGTNYYNLSDPNLIAEVTAISNKFDSSLRNLLSTLNNKINDVISSGSMDDQPSHSPGGQASERAQASNNDALRFLTFRLDFSEFYNK